MGVVGMADPPREKGTLTLSLTSNTGDESCCDFDRGEAGSVGLGWAVR
jgi:hypothetical protein